MRGLAILLVLFWHYVVIGIPIGATPAFRFIYYFRNSWSGVDLFFVLSGFLIGGILLDNKQAATLFRTFYARRALRILPLYLVVLFACFGVIWLGRHGYLERVAALTADQCPWWAYLFLVQNVWMSVTGVWGSSWLGVTWSLAIEEQFYLTLPLLVWLLSRRFLTILMISVVALAPALRTVLYYRASHGDLAGYWLMPCRADALGLGVLVAILVRDNRAWRAVLKRRWALYALFALFFFGFAWLTWQGAGVATRPMTTYGYTVLAVMYATLLLIVLAFPGHIFARFFRTRVMREFGILAYGLYLYHQIVNAVLHTYFRKAPPAFFSPEQILVTAGAFIALYVLAKISWHYFEKPLVDFGHRFRYVPAGSRQPLQALHASQPACRG